jgi:hypothetical protein
MREFQFLKSIIEFFFITLRPGIQVILFER